jgi:hypothetical protein
MHMWAALHCLGACQQLAVVLGLQAAGHVPQCLLVLRWGRLLDWLWRTCEWAHAAMVNTLALGLFLPFADDGACVRVCVRVCVCVCVCVCVRVCVRV